MAWKWNPFTRNLDYYEANTGGGGGDPATTVVITHVANYSALPNPTTVGLYDIYIVDAAQGTKWLPGSVGGTYYPAGAYYSNLVNWVYSESAGQATQAEVNTGTVTDKFVTPDTLNNYSGWTKSKVGLSNVDNTTDANKPISTATQTALNLITNINWLGDYNNGYTYTVGDGVMFNGASFRMYNAIGAAGYAPSAYPGNWKQITEYVSPNDIGLGNVDNTSDANKPISTATQTALNNKADLVSGTVPSSQLPSYVDDVIEGYYSIGVFYSDAGLTTAIVPTTGKIYVDLLQNKSYRWSGSVYVSISNPISSIDELTDVTIASVTNGQLLQYNLTTSQWENKTITVGNGDMQKVVYDIDNDGIVDYAETIPVTVRNPSVSTILRRGTIVYLSGSTGWRPNAIKAQANAESTSSGTFGVVISDIATNSDGLVACLGTLHNLDTRDTAPFPFTTDVLVDGDVLWLDPNNAGYVTKTKPQAPNHIVFIGIVARTSPTLGRIVYRITNGFELDELHNVFINGTLANNHTLYYDAATSLWKTNTIPAVLGYTPVGGSGTINYVSKFTGTGALGNSNIFDNGTNVGVGTITPAKLLDVNGDALINGHTVGRGGGNVATNTAVGLSAGAATSSGQNTFFGWNAGIYNGSSGTVAVGYGAGKFYGNLNLALTSAGNCVYIGNQAAALLNSANNEIVIGSQAMGKGSNTVQLGNTSITNTYLQGDVETLGNFLLGANAKYLYGKNSSGISTRMIGINGSNAFYIGSIDANVTAINFNINGANLLNIDNTGLITTKNYTLPLAAPTSGQVLGYLGAGTTTWTNSTITQAPLDNSTKIATTEYVDLAVTAGASSSGTSYGLIYAISAGNFLI